MSRIDDARNRVKLFISTAAMSKKAIKKSVKKIDKATKKNAKDPKAFHDKMDAKLEKLAKKYKVSIRLLRNKTKKSSIVVGKLRNRPYGEVAKLFKEISNTSPVPQKMTDNGASFAVFGPRIIAASNGFDMEAIKAQCAEDAAFREKLKQIVADESDENSEADGTSTEDSNVEEEDLGDGDAEEEEDTTDEDIEEFIDYVDTNNVSQDTLNSILDAASREYIEGLKDPDSREDLIMFVYNILGYDDLKSQLSSQANKAVLTASTQSRKLLAPMRK